MNTTTKVQALARLLYDPSTTDDEAQEVIAMIEALVDAQEGPA